MASSATWVVALAAAVLLLCNGIEACNANCQAACRAAGGVVMRPPTPFLASCQITLRIRGVPRSMAVFFPNSYNPARRYPVWIHLHGAFSIKMSVTTTDIYNEQKYLLQASEASAYWEGVLTNNVAPGVIHIYPQSAGNAKTRQIWNSEFWRCSVGYCIYANDRLFLDQAMLYIKSKLRTNNRIFASGNSNGGMMLYTMICKSKIWAQSISGYIIQNSGIGRDYLYKECRPKAMVPILQIHGKLDPVIEIKPTKTVDNVWFAPQHSTSKVIAQRSGCPLRLRRSVFTRIRCDPQYCQNGVNGTTILKCNEYCRQKRGSIRPTVSLCVIEGSGHSTDAPYIGWHSQFMWQWIRRIAGSRK